MRGRLACPCRVLLNSAVKAQLSTTTDEESFIKRIRQQSNRLLSQNNPLQRLSPKMEGPETYQQVPLTIDPSTKAVTSSDPSLAAELEELNKMDRAFVALDAPNQIPPPPAPVNPKRTVQINKMDMHSLEQLRQICHSSYWIPYRSGTSPIKLIRKAQLGR